MNQQEIEKAWLRLSMHNSELLLRVADLEEQLRRQRIIGILKARIRAWWRR